ncbi:MAG: carbohydrate ABC transporter permease [Anaerolineae bacterium]|nr:carbohydrate ABC transporter permease [Anaerolineae bacterium]
MRLSHRTTKRLLDIGTYLMLGGVVMTTLLPIVWTLITSFKTPADIISPVLHYLPPTITLDNYFKLLDQSPFPRLMLNSVIVTAITVSTCLVIGSLAAYSLSRYRFRGRTQIMVLMLATRMFPVVLLLIPLFSLLRSLRLLDTYLGLALAYTTFLLPLCIWLLKGYFDAISPDLEDAARIDGCFRVEALLRIVLPIARPGIAATAVLIAIVSWNEFLFGLLLTSSDGARPWPVGLQSMVGEFELPWGQLAAGGILSVIPVVIFFSLVQRALIGGIASGAIKG